MEIVVQLQATVQKMQHKQMSMDQTLRRLSEREAKRDWAPARSGTRSGRYPAAVSTMLTRLRGA
jgi:hypothetical protein